MDDERPRVGISACLLGQPVRFDTGHKRDPFLVEVLGPQVQWVPVCPEVEAGFGTPREPMRLVFTRPSTRAAGDAFDPEEVALVLNERGTDVTGQLVSYARRKVDALAQARLSGFVLKKDSPSCGMERVKVYTPDGDAERVGRGLFAAALMKRFPFLPVEEEGRLAETGIREHFVERVFAFARLLRLFESSWTIDDVKDFHAAYEAILLVRSPIACGELSRLVDDAVHRPRSSFAQDYEAGFMRALYSPLPSAPDRAVRNPSSDLTQP